MRGVQGGMTRTGGHGVPGCQLQVFSHTSQRNSQALLACLMSSRNAPQRGHCAMKVDARYVDRSGAGARLAPALGAGAGWAESHQGAAAGPSVPGGVSGSNWTTVSFTAGAPPRFSPSATPGPAGTGAWAVTGATGSGG